MPSATSRVRISLRPLRIGHDRAFGDFQDELAAGDAVRGKQRGDVVGELRIEQAPGGEVDRDRQRHTGLLPDVDLPDGFGKHQIGEGADHAGALGVRDELVRHQQPALRVLPAHERFEAGELAGLHVELGLVVQDELARVGEGGAQLGDQRQAERAVVVEHPVVHRQPQMRLLRDVHGDIRVLQQGLEIGAVLRRDGDADAGLDVEAGSLEHERSGEFGPDAPAQRLRVHRIGNVRQQDDELVTAEPGDAVALAHDGGQPRADLLQQQVAMVMAESVVDLLEPVEVEEQQRHPPAGTVRPLDGGQRAAAQELAIRQPRERIVVGEVVVVVGLLAKAPRRVVSPAGRARARTRRVRRAAQRS